MAKKNKVLILLSVIFLLLLLYLILTSESVKRQAGLKAPAENSQPAPLEADYQPRVKELFAAFEAMARGNSLTGEKISELKNKLLTLTVPAKFKQLHLSFVQLLDKIDSKEKSAGQQMASQLKADYGWLSN